MDPRFKSNVVNQSKAIAVNERHFAIIVLKDKNGEKVQNILQKSEVIPFSFKKVDHINNSRDLHPYVPTSVEGTKLPYYNYDGY